MNEDDFLKETILDVISEMINNEELKLSLDILPDYNHPEYKFGGVERYSQFKILTHLISGDNLVGYWENNFNSSIIKDILVGRGESIVGREEIHRGFDDLNNKLEDVKCNEEGHRGYILEELRSLRADVNFLINQLKEKNE